MVGSEDPIVGAVLVFGGVVVVGGVVDSPFVFEAVI
jgi:hypothetical protein